MTDAPPPRDHRALAVALAGVGLFVALVVYLGTVYGPTTAVPWGPPVALIAGGLFCVVASVRMGLTEWQRSGRVPSVAVFYVVLVLALGVWWVYAANATARIGE